MRTLRALIKTRLLALRDSLIWYFFSGILFPFLLLFFASQLNTDPKAKLQLIAGSIVSSAVLSTVFLFGQSFAAQRYRGEYELYATLPISKLTFVLALLVANLLTSSVSVIALLGISAFIFQAPLNINLWLIPTLILAALSVVGIGLLIGVLSRGPGEAAIICNLAVYLLSYAAPVFYPMAMLPPVMREFSRLIPTTQAANAVQATLEGGSLPLEPFLILSFWCITLLAFVTLKLDWRLR